MSRRSSNSETSAEDTRAARMVMTRAIRRLNVLEWLLLGAAAVASLAGGWLAALLGRSALGLPFRTTWMVASLLLFLIPGGMAWVAERRSRSVAPGRRATTDNEDQPE